VFFVSVLVIGVGIAGGGWWVVEAQQLAPTSAFLFFVSLIS
jgi:hypothetical protein